MHLWCMQHTCGFSAFRIYLLYAIDIWILGISHQRDVNSRHAWGMANNIAAQWTNWKGTMWQNKFWNHHFFELSANRTLSLQFALLSRQIAFISRVQNCDFSEENSLECSALTALVMQRHLSSATEALAWWIGPGATKGASMMWFSSGDPCW